MAENQKQQSVLIIAGMHRSGTSLTSSLLQSGGLNIGERLMGEGDGNIKGHFEDWDFVEFHENVLASQGISKEGWTKQKNIPVSEQDLERAKLILKSKYNNNWGWKDPRTTLFLDFWAKLIPEANFIFVYRSPWEVVDSLYRRGDRLFQLQPHLALEVWLHYNMIIKEFYDNNLDRCLLFNIETISSNPQLFLEVVARKTGIKLKSLKEEIYQESLLNRSRDFHSQSIIKEYFPEALAVYAALEERKEQMDGNDSSLARKILTNCPSYKEWVMQDWLERRNNQLELGRLKAQIHLMQSSQLSKQKFLFGIDSAKDSGKSEEIVVSDFILSGWCISTSKMAIKAIRAKIEQESFDGVYGIYRPDVVHNYSLDTQAACGFKIPVCLLPKQQTIQIEVLDRRNKWHEVGSHSLRFSPPLKFCFDRPQVWRQESSTIFFSGWCCHREVEIKRLVLSVADIFQDCSYGNYREDVHLAYPDWTGSKNSGFTLSITVPPGQWPVTLKAYLETGEIISVQAPEDLVVSFLNIANQSNNKLKKLLIFARDLKQRITDRQKRLGRSPSLSEIPRLLKKLVDIYRS